MNDTRYRASSPELQEFLDPVQLALRMKRLAVDMDRRTEPNGFAQYCFDHEPFGSAYVTVSTSEQGPVASSNSNRVTLCGTEEGLTVEGLKQIAGLFRKAGVKKYYLWLSPGPQFEVVRGWLMEAGMKPNPYVRYPTLARDATPASTISTNIDVQQLTAREAEQTAKSHDGIA